MADSDIESELTRFIVQEVLAEGEDFTLRPDQPLLSGAIDSFGLMTIITFVEERFDVAIDVRDVTTANFRSVRALAAFVQSQVGGAAASAS